MVTLDEICQFLETFAPTRLAEDWDNVGLLVGDRAAKVGRIMTCLTVTPASAREAIDGDADLIVTHHPLPFRPISHLTCDTTPGRLLWELIRAGIGVYSPHTAFDSASEGINQRLAQGLGLTDISPLVPHENEPAEIGAARYGCAESSITLGQLVERTKAFLSIDGMHVVGDCDRPLAKIAVACGSAGSFLSAAQELGCDALVTGETSFHTCLEAEASDVCLLLPGHYASERFAVEYLAEVVAGHFPGLHIWSSQNECDPLRWV